MFTHSLMHSHTQNTNKHSPTHTKHKFPDTQLNSPTPKTCTQLLRKSAFKVYLINTHIHDVSCCVRQICQSQRYFAHSREHSSSSSSSLPSFHLSPLSLSLSLHCLSPFQSILPPFPSCHMAGTQGTTPR